MRHFRYFALCLLASFGFSADTPLARTIAALKKYIEELPQEKIYIHSDRTFYSTGERIWFKAYLVAGPQHVPSPLSSTLYVELLDQESKLVQQIKLLANNGSAGGDFKLPDTLHSGNYLIRAYTQWMRNFNEDYFFHRPITIWNPGQPTPLTSVENSLDVRFFPEGGEWVSGFRSKLAFKAVGQDGLGKKIKGKIVDEAGQPITTFESNFLGMGWCAFVPQKDKIYRAIVDSPPIELALPRVQESGIAMSVTNSPDQKDVVIRIQASTPQTINLIAQTRGLLCFGSQVVLRNPISFVKVPKVNFPTGVAQITILDDLAIPRAERLVYVDNGESLSLTIKANKEVFAPREMITLTIEAKDREGNPVASDLSIAVCDDQQVPVGVNGDDLTSYLYLSSDLKGTIESPGYYFNPENPDRLEALDVLLLTQGWRRFLYPSLLSNDWPKPSYPVEQGLTLKGRLVDKSSSKPVAGGKVQYLNPFPIPDIRTSYTDATGYFEIPHLVYFDSAHAMLQGETKKGGKWVKVIVDSIPEVPPSHYQISPLRMPATEFEKGFINLSKERRQIDQVYRFDEQTIVLDAVEIQGKREENVTPLKKVYGPSSASIQVANNLSYENMTHPLQLLQGRVAGVQVSGNGLDWIVTIRGPGSIASGTAPMILVNNVQYDIMSLSSLNVRDIESIEVYKGPDTAIFGLRGANGVIAFYTKTGASNYVSKEGPYHFNRAGFHTSRQFYAPRYETQRPEHVKPDLRPTLFWASNIRTDSTGMISVSFYNHDLSTTVTGVVEGISTLGLPGRAVLKYAISK